MDDILPFSLFLGICPNAYEKSKDNSKVMGHKTHWYFVDLTTSMQLNLLKCQVDIDKKG